MWSLANQFLFKKILPLNRENNMSKFISLLLFNIYYSISKQVFLDL